MWIYRKILVSSDIFKYWDIIIGCYFVLVKFKFLIEVNILKWIKNNYSNVV